MNKKNINYSHYYSKLDKKFHSTIRKTDKLETGIIYKERVNGKPIQDVRILFKQKSTLKDLQIQFLRNDTDLETREEIYVLFNSFKKIIADRFTNGLYLPYDFDKDIFTIYHLRVQNYKKRLTMEHSL